MQLAHGGPRLPFARRDTTRCLWCVCSSGRGYYMSHLHFSRATNPSRYASRNIIAIKRRRASVGYSNVDHERHDEARRLFLRDCISWCCETHAFDGEHVLDYGWIKLAMETVPSKRCFGRVLLGMFHIVERFSAIRITQFVKGPCIFLF